MVVARALGGLIIAVVSNASPEAAAAVLNFM
jgi:hypothetical protein